MASFNKVTQLFVRLTTDEKRRAETAAKIVSRQRRETVAMSTLARELLMPELDRIIAENGRSGDRAA